MKSPQVQGATYIPAEEKDIQKAERILKMIGAIEAMQELIDHARAHLYGVDEEVIEQYIKATKKELHKIEKEKTTPIEGPRTFTKVIGLSLKATECISNGCVLPPHSGHCIFRSTERGGFHTKWAKHRGSKLTATQKQLLKKLGIKAHPKGK